MAEKIGNGDTASAASAAAALAISVNQPPATNVNKKRTPDQYTKNFDLNEIKPLKNDNESTYECNEQDLSRLNGGGSDGKGSMQKLEQVNLNMSGTMAVDGNDRTFLSNNRKEKNMLRGTYESVLSRLDISEKAKLPFLLANSLCAILLIILVVLIAFWPRIPYYMKASVCVDKECMDSSAQVSGYFFYI